MKLYYIGTGAADWTQEAGARDGVMRRFTCTLLDDALLIDLAPTTPRDLFCADHRLAGVTDVLYTHSHDDHYDADTLAALAATRPVHVWAEASFATRIPPMAGVEVHALTPGVEIRVGRYTVLPLPANHALRAYPEETALHYIISDGTSRIFWGADGAWLLTETWRALRLHAPYDRIILDGTLGEASGDYRIFEHNSLPMLRLMRDAITEASLLTPAGEIWLTHLSRDAHVSPRELKINALRDGMQVAEDECEDLF